MINELVIMFGEDGRRREGRKEAAREGVKAASPRNIRSSTVISASFTVFE